MRSIKIYLPFFILLCLATLQIATAQTKVGITAGVNFSDALIKNDNGKKQETEFMPGFRAGLTIDIPVVGDLYIQPAAVYSRKGFKQSSNWFSGIDNEFEATASYIEVPINILYKPKVGAGNLVLGAGAYAGYGLGGQWKTQTDVSIGDIRIENSGEVTFKNDASTGEFGEYLYGKPLDYGVNALAGYDFGGAFSVQFQAQFGLANLQPEWDGHQQKGTFNNRNLNLSLGYKF